MTAPLVFLDLETTGLNPRTDDVWEFAAIRREADGSETRYHEFVKHDELLRDNLPEPFRSDAERRFNWEAAISRRVFDVLLGTVLAGKPRIVGACPWFDVGFLASYVEPTWSHRLVDVEALAAGKLGRLVNGLADAAQALGIDHPAAHTAMGDAETAMRVYDAVMGGQS